MGSKTATIGYKYYLGVQIGVCHGPVDAVTAIHFEDRQAWVGNHTTLDGSIYINREQLFGGLDAQGGVRGYVDVRMGAPNQVPSAWLVNRLGVDNAPTYRGMLTLNFRDSIVKQSGAHQFYWSAMNPYIKPVSVTVRRILSGWSTAVWKSDKAAIGSDMNPAHIIYQALTDQKWGMGYPTSFIGSSFDVAADRLHTEGLGLSLIWTGQQPIEDFIKEILRHIDGAVYQNRVTGNFELKLLRLDYAEDELPIFDPSNVLNVLQYQRSGWGDTINEVIVVYTDPQTEKDASVSVQDLANIRIQGGLVSQTTAYPGVRSASLAYKLAQRDLLAASSPLVNLRFEANRDAWSLNPGDVFVFNWPDYDVSGLILRVVNIDYGSLQDGRIVVEAVEDVFAYSNFSYGAGQDDDWIDPASPATQMTGYNVSELTYYEVQSRFDPADLAELSAEQSFVAVWAHAADNSPNRGFDLYSSFTTDTEDFEKVAYGPITPRITLISAINQTDTVIAPSYSTGIDETTLTGKYFLVDSEIMLAVGPDPVIGGLMIVKRGVLDTIPAQHAAGALCWVHNGELGAIDALGTSLLDEEKYFRLVGATVSDRFPLDTALQTALYTHTARWARPWPPAAVRFRETFPTASDYFPATVYKDFEIFWNGRNRVLQTEGLTGWYESHIAPEFGTTYTIEVWNATTNTLIEKAEGIEVTTFGGRYQFIPPVGDTSTSYRIVLYAVRDSIESQYRYEHVATVSGELGIRTPQAHWRLPFHPVFINGSWMGYEDSARGNNFWYANANAGAWTVNAAIADNFWSFFNPGNNRCFGDNRYAVEDMQNGYCYTTTDFATFTDFKLNTHAANRNGSGGTIQVRSNGTNLFAIRAGGRDILKSTGGVWTNVWSGMPAANPITTFLPANNASFDGFSYVNGEWFAVCIHQPAAGVKTYVHVRSPDMYTWTSYTPSVSNANMMPVAYGAGYYWTANGMRSPDAVTWTDPQIALNGAPIAIGAAFMFGGQLRLIGIMNLEGWNRRNYMATTSNGTTFTITELLPPFNYIADLYERTTAFIGLSPFGDDEVVFYNGMPVLGDKARVLRSTNLQTLSLAYGQATYSNRLGLWLPRAFARKTEYKFAEPHDGFGLRCRLHIGTSANSPITYERCGYVGPMGTEDIPELNLQSLRIPFQYRAGKRQFEVTFISSDISKGGAILGYNGTSPLKEHKVLVGVYADRSGWAYNDKGAIIERKFVSRIASENNPPINPDTGLAERGQDYEPPERRYGFVFEKKGTVTPWSPGEVVTVAVDFDAGTVRFLKAGVLLFERNLPQGSLGGIMFHVIASSATINVGQAAFAHSQAGYATWE